MFDTTGLTEVKGQKRNGWAATYYLNEFGECVARVCSRCRELLPRELFGKGYTYGTSSKCKKCISEYDLTRRGFTGSRQDEIYRANRARTDEEIAQATAQAHPTGTKRCSICKCDVPIASYYVRRMSNDGLQRNCYPCDLQRILRRLKKHWTSKGIPFDQCIYCQMMTDLTPGDLHGDHVIARAIGGPDDMSNIAPACYACNICKGEETLEKFLAEQFFYEEDRQEILDRLRQYGYAA